MAYATTQNMLDRYDVNRLGQLVADDGVQRTKVQLLSDAVLEEMLADASGYITSALIAGNRYRPEDLATLSGDDAKLLIRLTCDIAFGLLLQRRGYPLDQIKSIAPGYLQAFAWLDRMADGQAVFNLDEARDAGRTHPEVVVARHEPLLSSTLTRVFGHLELGPRDNRHDRTA